MWNWYDLYLPEHRGNVYKAYCWIEEYIPEVLDVINFIDNAERQALKDRIVFLTTTYLKTLK